MTRPDATYPPTHPASTAHIEDVLAFDECDPTPGEATLAVLHPDPSRPWGFTRTPYGSDEPRCADDE